MSRMADLTPEEAKRAQAFIQRKTQEAKRVLKEGTDRAGSEVAARMRPLARDAAIVAKELVAKGIPPGQAIRAVASVAQWKFLWGEIGPFAADAAALSPAPIQMWRRRIRGEF